MQIPSACDIAAKLITDNKQAFIDLVNDKPGSFVAMQILIAECMKEYENACNKFVHRESDKTTLMTTSELFKKHFPEVYDGAGVGLFHKNIEPFFRELNEICLKEDANKKLLREPTEDEVYDVEHEDPKDYINEIDF